MRRAALPAALALLGAAVLAPGCRINQMRRVEALGATDPVREGSVVLRCVPDDAEVSLDGVPVGLCRDYATDDKGLPMGPGDHTLDFRKRGYAGYRTTVDPDRMQAVVHARLVATDEASPAR